MSKKPAKADKSADKEVQSEAPKDVEALEIELQMLKTKLEQADEKVKQNWDIALRAKAEADNIRRRAEKDVEHAHKYGSTGLLEAMIPVLDSLEQGMNAVEPDNDQTKALLEGMVMTDKLFKDTLAKFGVEGINPVGQTFNPEHHEAIAMQPSEEHKPNTVMDVVQKGYLLNGRLLRPAKVVVVKS